MSEADNNQIQSAQDIASALITGLKASGMVMAPAPAGENTQSQFERVYDALAANEETDKEQLDLLRRIMDAKEQDLTEKQKQALNQQAGTLLRSIGEKQAVLQIRAAIQRLTDGDDFLSELKDDIEERCFRTFNNGKDYEKARIDVAQGLVDPDMVTGLVKASVEHYQKLDKRENKSSGLSGMSGSVSTSQMDKHQKTDDAPTTVEDLNSLQKDWYYERFTQCRRVGMKREDAEKEAMRSTLAIPLLAKHAAR